MPSQHRKNVRVEWGRGKTACWTSSGPAGWKGQKESALRR